MQFLSCFVFVSVAAICLPLTSANYTLIDIDYDPPLITEVQHDITCSYSGDYVAAIQWVLRLGPLEIPYRSDSSGAKQLVLSLYPTADLDGSEFLCRVIDPLGERCEKSIIIIVRDLEHIVNVSASVEGPVLAGTSITLTCIVESGRATELSWIGPDGQLLSELPDGSITISTTSNMTELTLNSIRTSQAGNYTCKSVTDDPVTVESDSYVIFVEIPEPKISIVRDPLLPPQLFTNDSLVLTCVIELIPQVDSYVAIHSQWRGHSSLTNSENRVIISDLTGLELVYNTSVTFYSLQSSDSGSYLCSANISPIGSVENVVESFSVEASIDISIVLRIFIEVTYDPPSDFTLPSPPYYRPASSVTLTCRTYGTTGAVTYQWTSTCTSCFVTGSTSQAVSDSVLESIDAGIHTCTAVDSIGNNGSSSTEMRLIGAGIYVHHSYYYDDTAIALPNNSLILRKSSSCYYCKVDIVCHSNSTSQGVGQYILPNGASIYSHGDYYNYNIYRIGNAGVRIRSYRYDTPSLYGIFTCELPDSLGNILHTSIGIYSSWPDAPSVYSIKYTDWSNNYDFDVFGTVECLTEKSPPTKVTWLRDGVPVEVDGMGYEMMQIVTNRYEYLYNNTLIIRNAADLAGRHTYSCTIENRAGNTTSSVETTLSSYPILNIAVSDEALYSTSYNITCEATLNPKLTEQLLDFIMLEWVRVDEYNNSQVFEDGVAMDQQQTFSTFTTRSLIFNSLNMSNGGNYMCVAKLKIPDPTQSIETAQQYHLNVLNRTIFQLKFGPVAECSKWYADKKIAEHLERDVKACIAETVNEACDCGFQVTQIDQGEFGCRTLENGWVIYRARLEGSSDTRDIPTLLDILKDWMITDGTFLYHYHARLRLGVDPVCPIDIMKFSDPEC